MKYIGTELELFREARQWKSYWSTMVRRYVRGDVLEVGAGIGGNLAYLVQAAESFTALEPDAELASEIERRPDEKVRVVVGTLETHLSDEVFDTILYIDVLEHLQDDTAEFERAFRRLRVGGHLIVLGPAHQSLMSPFDEAVGHVRRYSTSSLSALSAGVPHCRLVTIRQLDVFGLLLSFANRYFKRARMPTPAEIRLWDRVVVPLSRLGDALTFYILGKSILGVWLKE